MKIFIKKILKPCVNFLNRFGFDIKKLASLRFFFHYRKDKANWLRQGGKISKNYVILSDFADSAGEVKHHYFHQDLLVAKLINHNNPTRHIDIGSRIDGFVAHVASFREIEVCDIRPLENTVHENIKFKKFNMMNPSELGKTDSLSCLHAVEHFGMGRYNDPIDINGHVKGINNLVSMLSKGGTLYLSFPIGQENEVHFNAHRIFHPSYIFQVQSIAKNMILERFDYVDDFGNLHLNISVEDVDKNIKFGCGIYTFKKR